VEELVRTLSADNCTLKFLDLSCNEITDGGVQVLCNATTTLAHVSLVV
jgi:hypothetical protein